MGEKRTQGKSPELVSNLECINRYPLIKLYIGTEQEMSVLELNLKWESGVHSIALAQK